MATGLTAQQRWEQHRDQLLNEIQGADEIVVLIPGWEPVRLEEGLRWLRISHYEALTVAHEVRLDGKKAFVCFTISED